MEKNDREKRAERVGHCKTSELNSRPIHKYRSHGKHLCDENITIRDKLPSLTCNYETLQ